MIMRTVRANYSIVEVTNTRLVIRDTGPWDINMSVTNDAEAVVESLLPRLGGRRLFYFDSMGDWGELLVKNGRFAGWGPGT